MNRVAIIGSPGAGKTTFARKLADITNLPLIHLDYYYHDKNHDYEHDKESWRRRVQELIHADRWITDGNYSSTYDLRLPAADTIVFFNVSPFRALQQVIKRRVKYHESKRPDMPDDWQEKTDWEFLKYVWGFKKRYANDIKTILEDYEGKDIHVVRSPDEANELLKQLS